jgi:hypothetical protein
MSSLLEPETMPLESHLAAIVILLSASALLSRRSSNS